MNLIQDPKKWGTGEFILVAILAAGVFYLYQEGYFTRKGQRKYIDPQEGAASVQYDTRTGQPTGSAQQTLSEAAISNIVSQAYEAYVNSWGFWNDSAIEAVNSKLIRLSDAELIQVANAYGQRYATDQEPLYRSLAGLLRQETIGWGAANDTRYQLLDRLNRLNLA